MRQDENADGEPGGDGWLPLERRRFLASSAAGTGLSLLGMAGATGQASATAIGTGPGRLPDAHELRVELSDQYVNSATWPGHPDNGDESAFNDKRGNYVKGLRPANQLGEVHLTSYNSLLNALQSGDPADFASIAVGGDRQLVAPQTAHRYRTLGLDPHQGTMPPAPKFQSDEMGAEMAEVYWHALVRDVPFVDYGSYSGTHTPQDAVQELNQFSNFTGPKQGGQVTIDTLFRMGMPGCLQGPYVSQYLWRDVPYGALTIERKINEAAPTDYLTNYDDWLENVGGLQRRGAEFPPTTPTAKTGNQVYIRNGRDLGEYVHVNFSYQPYLSAGLITFFDMGAPMDPAIPHTGQGTQDPYTTFGGFSLTELLATIAGHAVNAAWFHKWLVHRRVRPETFAGRVHNQHFGNKNYGITPELMSSNVLSRIVQYNDNNYGDQTLMLPLAYAEGAPAHPSYPSGHATIAGACVTVLKILFDGSHTITNAVEANASGTSLNPINFQPTVKEELNKLAANVSIGRNFGGVHYRSDGPAALRLGEQIAHNAMEYVLHGANEGQPPLEYENFDGNTRHLF